MAHTGDLGKLPPEIRKEIYTYLLVESKVIPVKRFLHKDEANFGEYLTTALLRHESPLRQARSVLRVSKLVNEEATQVLYGCNKFMFQHAGALRSFLNQIGDMKTHLRHVGISEGGYIFMNSWKAMNDSIKVLASSARGLRTLEFSHLAFCHRYQQVLQVKELVKHYKPLLQALHDEFVENNLNASVFDVIEICLAPCVTCSSLEDSESEGLWDVSSEHSRSVIITDYTSAKGATPFPRPCGCLCLAAEKANNDLMKEVKEEIVKQLDLQMT